MQLVNSILGCEINVIGEKRLVSFAVFGRRAVTPTRIFTRYRFHEL